MAVTATRSLAHWLEQAPAAQSLSPAARLTAFLLCDAVHEQRIQAGYAWEAWPSRTRLGQLVGVTPRQITRITHQLEALGVIVDTGLRIGRGVVKWEIIPQTLEDTPSTPDISVTGDADVRGRGPQEVQGGHGCPPGVTSADAGSDARVAAGGHRRPTEPEEPRNLEPDPERRSAAETAADASSPVSPLRRSGVVIFDREYRDLLDVYEDPDADLGERREARLRLNELDGDEVTMDVWRRRLLDDAAAERELIAA